VSGNILWIKLCPADLAFRLGPATLPFKGQRLFDLDTEFLGLVNLSFFFFFFLQADKRRTNSNCFSPGLGLMQVPL